MNGKLIKTVVNFKLPKEDGKIIGVYKLYNPRFPHIYYVGSSKDIRVRLNSHARGLEKRPRKHKNFRLVKMDSQFPNEMYFEITKIFVGDGAEDSARKHEQFMISNPPAGDKLLNIDKRVFNYRKRK